MAESREDRRVRKTKAQLRQSLARLMAEKPLKDITVKELTEDADVNRGTFYSHYKDIYDLRDQMENEAFQALISVLNHYPPETLRQGLRPLLTDIFRFVLCWRGEGDTLLGPTANPLFLDRIKAELSRRVEEEWRGLYHLSSSAQWDYYLNYVVAGWVAMLQVWTGSGMKESPEEMAAMAEQFILFGLQR